MTENPKEKEHSRTEGLLMDDIVSLAKRRGFVFPGSEIYGGLAGTWDYGPLGAEMKLNLKREYWRTMVHERDDTIGFDGAIMMSTAVWKGSGHTDAFTDPLVECKVCHERFRADHPDEINAHEAGHEKNEERVAWTEPRRFNLLVEARVGAVEDSKTSVYLRGEITQSVHVNFKNVHDATGKKLPFGVVQIGKAFRNEITPGNFTFRSREFEQMELQYYVKPDEGEALRMFEYWKQERMKWYMRLGLDSSRLRFRDHAENERAHYARMACDIEYQSPFGWKEFEGIHHRGGWDLSRHAEFSGKDMTYFDEEIRERYVPWVIETSGGVDRAVLFFLADAYRTEEVRGNQRIVLMLHPRIAPYKAAVFPLVANKPHLAEKAREIYAGLKVSSLAPVAWDDRGNIGKRYFSQDEIGTPWCITVDYQTIDDGTVTVRERDTMQQERVSINELVSMLEERLRSF